MTRRIRSIRVPTARVLVTFVLIAGCLYERHELDFPPRTAMPGIGRAVVIGLLLIGIPAVAVALVVYGIRELASGDTSSLLALQWTLWCCGLVIAWHTLVIIRSPVARLSMELALRPHL